MSEIRVILCVTLPLPAPELSPNARAHWRTVATKKRYARDGARVRAQAVLNGAAAPRWEAAEAQLVFYHKAARNRDGDNALASAKAQIDGIADAGIVANDKAFRFAPVEFRIDKAAPRLEITISPLSAA